MQGAAQACQQQGLAFLPIAVEILRGFHKAAVKQVKRIGAALARHQGCEEHVAATAPTPVSPPDVTKCCHADEQETR